MHKVSLGRSCNMKNPICRKSLIIGGEIHFTKGKSYELFMDLKDFYVLFDNAGLEYWLAKWRFKEHFTYHG
jgi:hypothetical protein